MVRPAKGHLFHQDALRFRSHRFRHAVLAGASSGMAGFRHLMAPPRPTELAQMILRESICEGDVAIDATAGNGHDTVFLAELVGETGRVLAFDIQETAIRETRRRLVESNLDSRAELHRTSHACMADHAAEESVSAIMFNLGYLPGADHDITTSESETLAALAVSESLLKPGGILSVVCYPGHPAGAVEAGKVEAWMTGLASHGWRIAKYAMLGTLRPAPFLLTARKP